MQNNAAFNSYIGICQELGTTPIPELLSCRESRREAGSQSTYVNTTTQSRLLMLRICARVCAHSIR